MEKLEEKKQRFLDLYEKGETDITMFTGRIQDLQGELDKLVSFERVHALISEFQQLLEATDFEQKKTLLHLVVQKIRLNEQKEIEEVELTFDKNIEEYFQSTFPSADEARGIFVFLAK